jgi:hypothetical protein
MNLAKMERGSTLGDILDLHIPMSIRLFRACYVSELALGVRDDVGKGGSPWVLLTACNSLKTA